MTTTHGSKNSFKDVLSLLKDDHTKVNAKFEEFENLGNKAYVSKKNLADEICQELSIHTQLEEELFYPAVQREIKELASLVEEGLVEHQTAKRLIKEIQKMSVEEELFDAKVKVLAEQIQHHVKEEEQEMFPKIRNSKLDLVALLEKVMSRKEALMKKAS